MLSDPEFKLPKTMAYLAATFSGDELVFRRNQIMRGLKKGHNEMTKMTTKYLFKSPLLFLLLAHQTKGKPFLHAMLSILKENPVEDVTLIHDTESSSWVFSCGSCTGQELKWYKLLSAMVPDVIHWWRQIGLNSDRLTKDLQQLSGSVGKSGGRSPLLKFKLEYSALFEYLHAVFGLMMSNSRLCKEIHGTIRATLRSGTGMDEADARSRSFTSGLGYSLKQERRDLASESAAGPPKKKYRPVKNNRSKTQ